jgi:hypothetical protein
MKILIAILSASMLGSTPPPSQPSAEGVLKLVTSLASVTVCRSDPTITLQATVLNGTDHVVEIDTSRLSSTVGFVALIDTEQMQFRHEAQSSTEDAIGAPQISQFVKIAPHGYYTTEMNVVLPKALFTTEGFYKMNVATTVPMREHRDVSSSNSFVLQMRSCG